MMPATCASSFCVPCKIHGQLLSVKFSVMSSRHECLSSRTLADIVLVLWLRKTWVSIGVTFPHGLHPPQTAGIAESLLAVGAPSPLACIRFSAVATFARSRNLVRRINTAVQKSRLRCRPVLLPKHGFIASLRKGTLECAFI